MASKKVALGAAVGLDIGSTMIKVVEAKVGKNGPSISGIGIAPTPEGTVENSLILDPAAVGQAVKKLLSESGIKSKPVISAVAGQSSVVVRVIEVPKMTKAELAETMKFEVERHVPFSPQEVIMDFAPIDKPGLDPDAQNMEVLLAVAQQDIVNNHVAALFSAGLLPKAIDIEPLAISRALIELDDAGAKNQTIAIVDIGANNTDLDIYEGGLLVFACPPLQIAGSTFTRAISDYLQIPIDEAERMKKQYAKVDPSKIGDNAPAYQEQQADSTFGLGGYDLGEPTIAGAAPQPDVEPEFPVSQSNPFGSAENVEVSAPVSPTQAKEDVFDLGGDENNSGFDPTFDMGNETTFSSSTNDSVSYNSDGNEAVTDESEGVVQIPSHDDSSSTNSAETEEQIAEAIAPILADLAAELRQSLGYYESKYGMLPEKVLMSGGTAMMRGLDTFLEGELGIPVKIADPFSNILVSSPRYSEQYLKEISPLFSVSIGLAVREMLSD